MDEPLLSQEQRRGLRQCSYCFRWRPLAELERHVASYGNREDPKRMIVWHVCYDGQNCWEARHGGLDADQSR